MTILSKPVILPLLENLTHVELRSSRLLEWNNNAALETWQHITVILPWPQIKLLPANWL